MLKTTHRQRAPWFFRGALFAVILGLGFLVPGLLAEACNSSCNIAFDVDVSEGDVEEKNSGRTGFAAGKISSLVSHHTVADALIYKNVLLHEGNSVRAPPAT